MRDRRIAIVIGISLAMVVAGCLMRAGEREGERLAGASATLGRGKVSTYAHVDAAGTLMAMGVAFHPDALVDLPTAPSDGHHCFDANDDGAIDPHTECSAWHERVIPLPTEISRRDDVPFKWVLLNWNPGGHIPPGVYDRPHFDVHFYMEPIENVFALRRGRCGPEFLQCDQFARATRPLPPNHHPPGYQNVDAAAPAMGNHLVDVSGPEFHGQPFTRTWIYGTYDGRLTFFEEMLTLEYLQSRPNRCVPIPAAAAVAVAGWYPTQSCVRFDARHDVFTVSLESFELREASAAEPVPAS